MTARDQVHSAFFRFILTPSEYSDFRYERTKKECIKIALNRIATLLVNMLGLVQGNAKRSAEAGALVKRSSRLTKDKWKGTAAFPNRYVSL